MAGLPLSLQPVRPFFASGGGRRQQVGERLSGRVIAYSPLRGNGRIQPARGFPLVFYRDCTLQPYIQVGDNVTYQETMMRRGSRSELEATRLQLPYTGRGIYGPSADDLPLRAEHAEAAQVARRHAAGGLPSLEDIPTRGWTGSTLSPFDLLT